MPFKVTPFRLEMIADILTILGVIAALLLFVGGAGFLAGIAVLLPASAFSYILYAVAKILRNTETILEHLENLSSDNEKNTDETETADENE